MGPEGAGKHRFVRRVLDEHVRALPVGKDQCYVNDFRDMSRPRALLLPAGRGRVLKTDMQALVDALRVAIRAAFESDDYRARRQALEHEVEERHQEALEQIHKEAKEKSLAFMRTPMGFAFAPTVDGEIVSPEVFNKLASQEQERLKQAISEMEGKLRTVLLQLPRLQREAHERVASLNREVADFAVKPLFDDLLKRYADEPEVARWVEQVYQEVREGPEAFLVDDEAQSVQALSAVIGESQPSRAVTRRYTVNLLVDRADHTGAPVVYEDHPTLENLVGRIEHRVQMGNLVTDFTLIQPGALHRASGGCLVLDVQKLLSQPVAYEALKRALRGKQVRIESLAESLGISAAGRLAPEPIPIDVKVVLLGDRRLYYLLSAYDPDFDQLFKVAADFEDDLPRDPASEREMAALIANMVACEKLRAFDAGAVARVLEQTSRACEDAARLSLRTQSVVDLLREADYFAQRAGRDVATADDVQRAIDAQIQRADRVRDTSLRMLEEGTVLLSTRGEAVGQINGLSVLMLGGFSFGRPSRITCRVRLGRGDVLDIEREVRLGGPIHSKGVLILSSLLSARYATEHPLSLSASLVFEQSYGGVDGDSASLAEMCALLSAIAEAPIAQRFAVTGSINQMGEVQPIGGVNEKIEGFFDACKTQGLTGEQAVIIPASNARHLMLRRDVVEAVEQGAFQVHTVGHVDEALPLLTGLRIGERAADGSYPEGSLNARVAQRLQGFAERAKSYGATAIERRVEVQPVEAPPPPSPLPDGGGPDGEP
jgi:lon-related putative ATP-dependent protease